MVSLLIVDLCLIFCIHLQSERTFLILSFFLSFFWMIQGTPVNIIVGSHVWTEDPDVAWIEGEVIGIAGINATIVTTDGKTVS